MSASVSDEKQRQLSCKFLGKRPATKDCRDVVLESIEMKFSSSRATRGNSRKSLSVKAEACELRTLLTATTSSVVIEGSVELPADGGDAEATSDIEFTAAACEACDGRIPIICLPWDHEVLGVGSLDVEVPEGSFDETGYIEFIEIEGLLPPQTGGLDPFPRGLVVDELHAFNFDGRDTEIEVNDAGEDLTNIDMGLTAYFEDFFASAFATTWVAEFSEGGASEIEVNDVESLTIDEHTMFQDQPSIEDLESWGRSVIYLSSFSGVGEVQRSNVSSDLLSASNAPSTLGIPVKSVSPTALFSSDRDPSPINIPAVAKATLVLGSPASLAKRNAPQRRSPTQLTSTRLSPVTEGLSNLSPILGGDMAPSETESSQTPIDSPPVEAGSIEETVSENGSSIAGGFAANQHVQSHSRRVATIDRVMAQYAEHLLNS